MTKQTTYYNQIATEYDDSRFANTYGQFIDQQEKLVMKNLLNGIPKDNILDLGCGTGRFLEFANYGVDASLEMLHIAKNKFPDKQLFVENGTKTHFDNDRFDIVFSFHVLMHLDENIIIEILNEAYRVLKKGGRLIFDIPSKKRRNLVHYKSGDWHGATGFSVDEIRGLCQEKWRLLDHQGVLFFPIHRVPQKLRKGMIKADSFLCRSFLKEYSSYLISDVTHSKLEL